jgi:hypothetical protein
VFVTILIFKNDASYAYARSLKYAFDEWVSSTNFGCQFLNFVLCSLSMKDSLLCFTQIMHQKELLFVSLWVIRNILLFPAPTTETCNAMMHMTFFSGINVQFLFDWWCTNEIVGYLTSVFVLFCIAFLNQFVYSLLKIRPKKKVTGYVQLTDR